MRLSSAAKPEICTKTKEQKKIHGRGGAGKAIVMGILERQGEVRVKVVGNRDKETLHAEIREHVESGAEVFTDALPSYEGLQPDYVHQVINHALEYVRGNVHANGIENFWTLVKLCIGGTYVSVEPFHLFRYLDEQAFRFNNRKDNDAGRFLKVCATIIGRRLTYEDLTGKTLNITNPIMMRPLTESL